MSNEPDNIDAIVADFARQLEGEHAANMAGAMVELMAGLEPVAELVIAWRKRLIAGGFDEHAATAMAGLLHHDLIRLIFRQMQETSNEGANE